MGFKLSGVPSAQFSHLFGMSDEELRSRNIVRMQAEPGFPCRVTLRDVEQGTPALLLHYRHHDVPSPYSSSGPIFVSEGHHPPAQFQNYIPSEMRSRLYSARAYDDDGFMLDGETVEGTDLEVFLEAMLAREGVAYVHLHHARRGCFACRVDRA